VSLPAAESSSTPSPLYARLPNWLSLFRIALMPPVVALILVASPHARVGAAVLFLVACITDVLDGWIARRYGITTALGQYLDPLADKLLVVAVLIMLAAVPPEPRVPAWIVVVITARELAVTGLRGIASIGGVILPAEELGKYKMVFQTFAVEALLLHGTYPIPGTALAIDFHAGGMRLLGIATVLAVWSAVDYHVRILRRLALD